MPRITIRLFAVAAQLAQSKAVELSREFSQPPQLSEVVAQLSLEYPQLQPTVQRSRWAINDEFVELTCVVGWSDQLALIPPVSGG